VTTGSSRPWRHPTLRGSGAAVLVVLAVLLAPVAATGWWVRTTVSDTDHYLEAVTPLSDDAQVRDAASAAIRLAVEDRLDSADPVDRGADALRDLTGSDELGDKVNGLGEPARDGLLDVVDAAVDRVMVSDAFVLAWRKLNAVAHRQVVLVLRGDSELVESEDGAVRLELASVIELVLKDADVAGAVAPELLSGLDASVPLFSVAELQELQEKYQLLIRATLALSLVPPTLALLALVVARHRVRTLLVMSLSAAVLLVLVPLLIDQLTNGLSSPTTGSGPVGPAVIDAVTRPLDRLCQLSAALIAGGGIAGVAVSGVLGGRARAA